MAKTESDKKLPLSAHLLCFTASGVLTFRYLITKWIDELDTTKMTEAEVIKYASDLETYFWSFFVIGFALCFLSLFVGIKKIHS